MIAAGRTCSHSAVGVQASPIVLITRPEEKARDLQCELEAKGFGTMIEPLLIIEPLGPIAPLSPDVQAIVLTSAEAVPALTDEAKRLPVFAVGEATGKAARAAGCERVTAGDRDGAALAALIAARCSPEDGAILHVAGEVVREDLQEILRTRGFEVVRDVVYRARPRTALSHDLVKAWRRGDITAVLLFSPRTAEILVRLLIEQGLTSHVDRTVAICVSELSATPCRELDWKEICLAPQPSREAMIRTLEGSIRIC